jgi:predicted O-methyltransferase YrrM
MIPDLEAYFERFIPRRDVLLKGLEAEAEKEGIPIIGPVVGELLFILARGAGARQILELGTATGYSAIYLARACEPLQGRVVTLEIDPGMAERARSNLEKAGVGHRVEVRLGDAREQMSRLKGPYDFIFMDIDKEAYHPALGECRRLLREGGLLVVDNVGFREADAFNQAVSASPDFRSVQLLSFLPLHSPQRDGLCLAVRT